MQKWESRELPHFLINNSFKIIHSNKSNLWKKNDFKKTVCGLF